MASYNNMSTKERKGLATLTLQVMMKGLYNKVCFHIADTLISGITKFKKIQSLIFFNQVNENQFTNSKNDVDIFNDVILSFVEEDEICIPNTDTNDNKKRKSKVKICCICYVRETQLMAIWHKTLVWFSINLHVNFIYI
ncbi:hypothetical protein ACJX0J_011448 [Zea mays]